MHKAIVLTGAGADSTTIECLTGPRCVFGALVSSAHAEISGLTVTGADDGIELVGVRSWYIHDNILEFNSFAGLQASSVDTVTVERNLIRSNGHFGVQAYAGVDRLVILSNDIVDNGDIGVYPDATVPSVEISNNIIASNGTRGIECFAASVYLDYNDVWNNPFPYSNVAAGPNDISIDPLFVGGSPYDYHLSCGSPCIDTGNPSVPNGPDGTRSDIGLYVADQAADDDGDAVADLCDNCPETANADQGDVDGDSIGDLCDNCMAYATPNDVDIITGDVNLDGSLTTSDIVFLVNFTLKGGDAPQLIPEAGDVNCDGGSTASDIIYMVSHVFRTM